MKSGWLTTGQVTKEFEDEFAKYVGARYAIALNSCTSALHLSLLVAGVKQGDEVITTPYTFVASVETIIHAGAKPVFVDTEQKSFNIDLTAVSSKINKKTKALLPVHIAGEPCNLKLLTSLKRKYKLTIIHDAAHALGAAWGNKMVGATPDFSCFSFYATKNLTTGEGGMVTLNNKRSAEKIRLLSLHGMSKGAWKRYSNKGSWRYQILDLGYKYNISDINSALGLAQLKKFKVIQKQREQLAVLYNNYLKDIEELELPTFQDGLTHAWHLYIVKIRKGNEQKRNNIIEKLNKEGIGTSVHFIPIYKHPYFKEKYKLNENEFPNSEKHYQAAISLPFYVDLKESEINYIATKFKQIFSK